MRFINVTLFLLVLMSQSAWAGIFSPTPYQPKNDVTHFLFRASGGGYQDELLSHGLMKITFYGNERTNISDMRRYVMYRAAEIGKKRHKKHFSIYQSRLRAVLMSAADNPAFETATVMPQAYAYVEYYDSDREGSFSVRSVYASYKKNILNKRVV